MLGVWVPDKTYSTCSKDLIPDGTKLTLRGDGTFLAERFPKDLSLGRQLTVAGRWSVASDGSRWRLNLPWETGSKSILDGAELISKGKMLLVRLWVGDPDLNQCLVLRKNAAP